MSGYSPNRRKTSRGEEETSVDEGRNTEKRVKKKEEEMMSPTYKGRGGMEELGAAALLVIHPLFLYYSYDGLLRLATPSFVSRRERLKRNI